MKGIEVYIYIIISLLGVAYPLLLQVIARLDEKYASDKILSLFNKEIKAKAFPRLLIVSLISLLFWTLLIPVQNTFIEGLNYLIKNSAIIFVVSSVALVISVLDERCASYKFLSIFNSEAKMFSDTLIVSLILLFIWILGFQTCIYGGLLYLIRNSAVITLAISTIALVISFFLFVDKILTYYTPSKVVPYLIKKHTKRNSTDDFVYFEALSDIILLSIKNQQREIATTLTRFFYTAFQDERERDQSVPVVYPESYYDLVNRSIEELAILKEKRNYALESRTAGGIWLLGELSECGVSEATYTWMWRNLNLAIRYKHDDMLVSHWETAHQFYTYSLRPISLGYNYFEYYEEVPISNKEDVDKRQKERKRFIEFYNALGGLLLEQQMYGCINRCFKHTNRDPPKYELLPEFMREIFEFYFSIRSENKYPWISSQYPFPKLTGLNADSIIKKWISSYMALLFLRQYTLFVPYSGTGPLTYPAIPQTQSEIKVWIDGLDFFEKLVSDHLKNLKLLDELELDFLTFQWCSDNNREYPIDFIRTFKTKLSEAYKNNALTAKVSPEKVEAFEASTKKQIEEVFDECKKISNTTDFEGDADKWYVHGGATYDSKDPFTETPETLHLNFDSFSASVSARDIRNAIGYRFRINRSKYFLLKPEDVFLAIDKLNLDDRFCIVCLGFNLGYRSIKTPELSGTHYKGIPIYSFYNEQIDRSLFILKKTDLPFIASKPIAQGAIDKYSLKKISETMDLYTAVIDLNNTTQEITHEAQQVLKIDELSANVILVIAFLIEIRWKKNIDVIQIMEYDPYKEDGIPNDLSDIKRPKKWNKRGGK